jgi:hypothetical protein
MTNLIPDGLTKFLDTSLPIGGVILIGYFVYWLLMRRRRGIDGGSLPVAMPLLTEARIRLIAQNEIHEHHDWCMRLIDEKLKGLKKDGAYMKEEMASIKTALTAHNGTSVEILNAVRALGEKR